MENRSNNGKNQTSSRSTNAVTNAHKHPNQYTKGADDEGAKNAKTTDSKAAKGSKNCR